MLKFSESNLEKKTSLKKSHEANVRAKRLATKRKAESAAQAAAAASSGGPPPAGPSSSSSSMAPPPAAAGDGVGPPLSLPLSASSTESSLASSSASTPPNGLSGCNKATSAAESAGDPLQKDKVTKTFGVMHFDEKRKERRRVK